MTPKADLSSQSVRKNTGSPQKYYVRELCPVSVIKAVTAIDMTQSTVWVCVIILKEDTLESRMFQINHLNLIDFVDRSPPVIYTWSSSFLTSTTPNLSYL